MGIEEEEKHATPPHRCRGRPGTDASTDADGRGVSMRMDCETGDKDEKPSLGKRSCRAAIRPVTQ